MARGRRVKPRDKEYYYHIISRITGEDTFLTNEEKQKLLNTIFYFNGIYTFNTIGYCIMGNHFHLVVRTKMINNYSWEEIRDRLKEYFINNNKNVEDLGPKEYDKYVHKLGDISAYVGSIKQHFACWYNEVNNRRGCLWGGRFKNIMLLKESGLQKCLSYIELNPVRAKMVKNPENYKFSSIHLRKFKKNEARAKLSIEGVFRGVDDSQEDEVYENYCAMVLIMAKLKEDSEFSHEFIRLNNVKPEPDLMLKRRREFSYGLCIGEKKEIQDFYDEFGEEYLNKKDRKPHLIEDSDGLYCVRRLKKPK